jgi:hypothetical protein
MSLSGGVRIVRQNTVAKRGLSMDTILIVILLLLLLGGGGGLYWGMGVGWGIGPIGLIVAVLVVAFFLNSRRTRL